MKSSKIIDVDWGAQVQIRKIARAIAIPVGICGALLLGGCGSGLPHSNEVIATVSPANATVPVGGSIDLVGNATGFTAAPMTQWWVQEAQDTGGDVCAYPQLPPTSPCPFGYVIYAINFENPIPSSATYYAPDAAGTYHVTFEATQCSYLCSDTLTKRAEATITVTP